MSLINHRPTTNDERPATYNRRFRMISSIIFMLISFECFSVGNRIWGEKVSENYFQGLFISKYYRMQSIKSIQKGLSWFLFNFI